MSTMNQALGQIIMNQVPPPQNWFRRCFNYLRGRARQGLEACFWGLGLGLEWIVLTFATACYIFWTQGVQPLWRRVIHDSGFYDRFVDPYRVALLSSVSFIGLVLIAFGIGFLEQKTRLVLGIFIPSAFVALACTLLCFLTPDRVRNFWWENPNFGIFADIVGNTVMFFLGVCMGWWKEKSVGSILIFGGACLWLSPLLYVVYPPTDFGLLVYLLTCVLNQAIKPHEKHKKYVLIYCAGVSSVSAIKTAKNPHQLQPETPIIPL